MIKEFIEQTSINKDLLKYDAGKVYGYEDNLYLVNNSEHGALGTFSTSQPVYDDENNLLGYLGLNVLRCLNYTKTPQGEDIPVPIWEICNPTKYCKAGVHINTFWQRWNVIEWETMPEAQLEK